MLIDIRPRQSSGWCTWQKFVRSFNISFCTFRLLFLITAFHQQRLVLIVRKKREAMCSREFAAQLKKWNLRKKNFSRYFKCSSNRIRTTEYACAKDKHAHRDKLTCEWSSGPVRTLLCVDLALMKATFDPQLAFFFLSDFFFFRVLLKKWFTRYNLPCCKFRLTLRAQKNRLCL